MLDKQVLINNHAVRESVWLHAWITCENNKCATTACKAHADSCLSAFDEKFPTAQKEVLDRMNISPCR